MSIFHAIVDAAHSAITSLAGLLEPVAGSLAAALAIVVFTLLVRLLISPLTYWQVRGQRRQAALAPHIETLRAKHPNDPMALAAATLELQRANGASPFAALLPALAQAPFFMVMYQVAMNAPAGAVFGVPLTAHLSAGLPVFAGLLVVAIALAWWSSRRMGRSMDASKTPADPASRPSGAAPQSPENKPRKAALRDAKDGARGAAPRSRETRSHTGAPRSESHGAVSQSQATPAVPNPMRFLRFLPFLTVAAVAWLPLAGGIYLVTSAAWTALEQLVWRREVTTGNR